MFIFVMNTHRCRRRRLRRRRHCCRPSLVACAQCSQALKHALKDRAKDLLLLKNAKARFVVLENKVKVMRSKEMQLRLRYKELQLERDELCVVGIGVVGVGVGVDFGGGGGGGGGGVLLPRCASVDGNALCGSPSGAAGNGSIEPSHPSQPAGTPVF
jgi:hypothetical protein